MLKHTISSFVLAVFVVFFASSHACAEQAVVTGNDVNVRTGPGTAYGFFTTIAHGTEVQVINRTNADWYLISWDGNSGYVSSEFLELEEEDHSAQVVTETPSVPGYINGSYVCLRSGPGTSYTILGTYSNGKELTINGTSGEWTAVCIDGKDGFVFSDFVSEGSPSSAHVQPDSSEDQFGGTPINPEISQSSQASVQTGSTVFVVQDVPPDEPVSSPPAGAVSSQSEQSPVVSVPITETEAGTSASTAPSVQVSVPESSPSVSMTQSTIPFTGSEGTSSGSPSKLTSNGEIAGNSVRLRSGPGTTYPIIDTFDSGTPLLITDEVGEWTAVIIQNKSGYIHSDYIHSSASDAPSASASSTAGPQPSESGESLPSAQSTFKVTDGYIVGSYVRLREAPSMSSKILAELSFGAAVKMTGISGDWTKVICNGQEGYVSSSFVTEGIFEPAAKISRASGAELGKEIAAYALKYLGTPYKWGGSSPTTGFDCSGFVRYVFSQFGYTTSRVANDVLSDGVHVDPADLQPGDVLCFYSGNNYCGHVGIYIGDNLFVHAANSAIGVVTTDLSTGYYASRGYEIRRII